MLLTYLLIALSLRLAIFDLGLSFIGKLMIRSSLQTRTFVADSSGLLMVGSNLFEVDVRLLAKLVSNRTSFVSLRYTFWGIQMQTEE